MSSDKILHDRKPEYLHHHPQDTLYHGGCFRCKLNSYAPELLEVCKGLLADTKVNLEAIGGCDHTVGICACGLVSLIEQAESIIQEIERR